MDRVLRQARQGRIVDDVGASDKYGNTALHLAAGAGHLECVNDLLRRGAPVLQNARGRTALHFAAKQGHTSVVEAIARARPDCLEFVDYLYSKKYNVKDFGYTALEVAASRGHVATVRVLASLGANTKGVAVATLRHHQFGVLKAIPELVHESAVRFAFYYHHMGMIGALADVGGAPACEIKHYYECRQGVCHTHLGETLTPAKFRELHPRSN